MVEAPRSEATSKEQSAPLQLPSHIQVGQRVYANHSTMEHFGYAGVVDEIIIPDKIWVNWTDGDRTHTRADHLSPCINKEPSLPRKCMECKNRKCEKHKKLREARKDILRFNKIVEKVRKTKIYISPTVHKRICEDYEYKRRISGTDAYPLMYMLGKNTSSIIKHMIILRGYGGCKNMPYLDTYELNCATKEMMDMNITPVGICRIGIFSDTTTDGITDVSRLASGFFLLSFNGSRLRANRRIDYKNQSQYVDIEVVIKSKTRGGDINAKEEKDKSNVG